MKKHLKHIPIVLCILYGFYPLMQYLGGRLRFGYELHSSPVSACLTAAISISATILLLKNKPAYNIIDRIALVLMLPLCIAHLFSMYVGLDSLITWALSAISFIACYVLFFSQNSRKWYTRLIAFIFLFPITFFTAMLLLIGGFMFDFSSAELLRSYEIGSYICYDYYVDEGALGESWYTDVYSKNSYPLVFGTFYPHYEHIVLPDLL